MQDPLGHRRVEGVAAASRLPSSAAVVVVPDDVLPSMKGPAPVGVEHQGVTVPAWAWAEGAWGDGAPAPDHDAPSGSPPTFWLSRLTVERLGIGPELGAVTLTVPEALSLQPRLPLVHDLPAHDEVQVAPGTAAPGRHVLVRNGVAAWVTLVPRRHVQPGTARISGQLRATTSVSTAARDDSALVIVRPVPLPPTRGRRRDLLSADAIRSTTWSVVERALRWYFLAPEQSVRVVPAHPDDDHQQAVTLHETTLARLGVRSGDRVIVRWGDTETEVSAVADHAPAVFRTTGPHPDPTTPQPAPEAPAHLTIRVPTALRYLVDLPAASVVSVRRSTRSVLARNLNSLVIPVASLVLAGAALNDPDWLLLTCGALATAALGLSRLRIGTGRAISLRGGRRESAR